MSAHISVIDSGTRTIWIGYEGRGEALEKDLDQRCINWIRSSGIGNTCEVHGRIGITFRPNVSEYEISRFAKASMRIVAMFTSSKNPTLEKRKQFTQDITLVQAYQKELIPQGDTL